MADVQLCPFHLKGHCKNKTKCALSHAISDCNMGSLCKDKKSCKFRHVRHCPLHPKCYFKKCSYLHPLLPHIPHHPPHHPPIPLPAFHPPSHTPHLPNIHQELAKLKAEFQERVTRLETEMKAIKQESPSERQEPDLEIVPTNQQEEVNIENCFV